MNSPYRPRARKHGLLIQSISEETILYDKELDRANLLNPTAAFVWQNADGTQTVSEIASSMSNSFGTPVDDRVVWYALDQLSKKNLLQEHAPVPFESMSLTRRQMLSKAGMVGAAFAIPVVVAMAAPSVAQAQSCTGGAPDGSPCGLPSQCCSGCCSDLVCEPLNSCI
jgi:hypothetical protein